MAMSVPFKKHILHCNSVDIEIINIFKIKVSWNNTGAMPHETCSGIFWYIPSHLNLYQTLVMIRQIEFTPQRWADTWNLEAWIKSLVPSSAACSVAQARGVPLFRSWARLLIQCSFHPSVFTEGCELTNPWGSPCNVYISVKEALGNL